MFAQFVQFVLFAQFRQTVFKLFNFISPFASIGALSVLIALSSVPAQAQKPAAINSTFIYYQLKADETLANIARRYGIGLSQLRKRNADIVIKANALIKLPRARIHVVTAGETLGALARREGIPITTFKVLLKTERRHSQQTTFHPELLYIGERLRLPIHYPSEVWLYSAYIHSQYQKLSDIIQSPPKKAASSASAALTTQSATVSKQLLSGHQTFSSVLGGKLVPIEFPDPLSRLDARSAGLDFTLPMSQLQASVPLAALKPYEISTAAFHPGVFYALTKKFPIKASEAGTIVFTAPLRGWGLALVVRHSENFFSFYSGMESVRHRSATRVRKAALLGYTRAGFFFALHYKGLPIDPFTFFNTAAPNSVTIPAAAPQSNS